MGIITMVITTNPVVRFVDKHVIQTSGEQLLLALQPLEGPILGPDLLREEEENDY